MKNVIQLFCSRLAAVAILTLALIGLSATAMGQNSVKIPAKSGNSLEEGSGETETQPPVQPLSPGFSGNSSISRVQVPTNPVRPANIEKRETPAKGPGIPSEVTAMQKVPELQRTLDPAVMKRLGELRRELIVQDSATKARISLPSAELFMDDALTTLDDLSVPTLEKVLEYIELNDKRNVTVQGIYVMDETDSKSLAWTRSLALIEWMTTNSKLPIENFKAIGPTPVTKATAKKNSSEVGDTEFVGRIDILLE